MYKFILAAVYRVSAAAAAPSSKERRRQQLRRDYLQCELIVVELNFNLDSRSSSPSPLATPPSPSATIEGSSGDLARVDLTFLGGKHSKKCADDGTCPPKELSEVLSKNHWRFSGEIIWGLFSPLFPDKGVEIAFDNLTDARTCTLLSRRSR